MVQRVTNCYSSNYDIYPDIASFVIYLINKWDVQDTDGKCLRMTSIIVVMIYAG